MSWLMTMVGALDFPEGGAAIWRGLSIAQADRARFPRSGLFSRRARLEDRTVAQALEHIQAVSSANASTLSVVGEGNRVAFQGTANQAVWLDIGAELGAILALAAGAGGRGDVLVIDAGCAEHGFRFELGDAGCTLSTLSAAALRRLSIAETEHPPGTPR